MKLETFLYSKEGEASQDWTKLQEHPELSLTSLDISVYAHLRALLSNAFTSPHCKYFLDQCPNLMGFFLLMESIFGVGMNDQ